MDNDYVSSMVDRHGARQNPACAASLVMRQHDTEDNLTKRQSRHDFLRWGHISHLRYEWLKEVAAIFLRWFNLHSFELHPC